MSEYVCVCVCVSESERERERVRVNERKREVWREGERQLACCFSWSIIRLALITRRGNNIVHIESIVIT